MAVGMLAGLAEFIWTYLLPAVRDGWHAVLPENLGDILLFLLAAIATDGLLVLVGGGLVLAVVFIVRVSGWKRATEARLRFWGRTALLAGAALYLFVGWLGLFVIPASQLLSTGGLAITIAGAVVIVTSAALVTAAFESQRSWFRRVTRVRVLCGTVCLLIALSTGLVVRHQQSLTPQSSIAPPAAAHGPRPNIVLVTIDTLRADYLGCYGHPWIETPTVDALARDGVVFDTAVAQAPSTGPSHTSIFTSVYPFDHEAENGKPMKRGLVTLADALAAAGYETVAFTSSTTTRSTNSRLNQGFDRYVDSLVPWSTLFGYDGFQHLIAFYLAGVVQHYQIRGEVVTDRALDWLATRTTDKPFFAWLHYFDPHDPYGAPPPFRGKYRGRINDGAPGAGKRESYAEDITYADHQLGRVMDSLRRRALYDSALIIVTSDHGEAFGEQHAEVIEWAHGACLYDTTQHVPLVIKPPGAGSPARRVEGQVQLVDLAPTILRFLDIDPPEQFVGRPLNSAVDGGDADSSYRDAVACNVSRMESTGPGGHEVRFLQQLSIRSPDWKYITIPSADRRELYDLRSDPAERYNIALQHAEVVTGRHAAIESYWRPEIETGKDPRNRLAPALVRQLQALGYLVDDGDDEVDAGEEESTPASSQPGARAPDGD